MRDIPKDRDTLRLIRASQLTARPVGRGKFLVTGGQEPHYVDLKDPSHPACDCGDHAFRDKVCKHIIRALLAVGDRRTITELGGILAQLDLKPGKHLRVKQELKEAGL